MQTPAISTLTLSTVPFVAEPHAGEASLNGTTDIGTSFAALFHGQAAGASASANPSMPPQPQLGALDLSAFLKATNIQLSADILPVAAVTGRFLPVPGKGAASGESSETPDAPDGMGGDFEFVDPELDPAVFGIAQPLSLGGAATPVALDPAALSMAQTAPLVGASTPSADVALRKTVGTKPDIVAQGSASAPAPQASIQLALADTSTTAPTGASVASAAAAQAAPAAGMIAVSIAAAAVVADMPTEQAIKSITTAERGGQPAAADSSAAQISALVPGAGNRRGETPQQGAGEDALRRTASSVATVAAPNVSAGDLFSAISAIPVVAAVDRAAATPAAAALPAMPAAAPDRADVVAHVVDRLMAAREVGLGALASIAIANRDFGDLTVSFSDNGQSLDVSVTAADADKQRALSAALTMTERPVTREPASQATQASQNTSATMQQDRNAEGQLARDSGGRLPRGEAMTEQRRAGSSVISATENDAAAPERSGIYV